MSQEIVNITLQFLKFEVRTNIKIKKNKKRKKKASFCEFFVRGLEFGTWLLIKTNSPTTEIDN